MRDTYKPDFWSVDYTPGQEEDIDPVENDKAMERYIERRRREFYKEWLVYSQANRSIAVSPCCIVLSVPFAA